MVQMWKMILKNKKVEGQIIDSVGQKLQGGEYLMQKVSPRDEGIIEEIKKVLKDWAQYGWRYFF